MKLKKDWFLADRYDDTIQPKNRTAMFLAERRAKELQRLGYKTKVAQRGNFAEVFTNKSVYIGTCVFKV